MSYTQINPQNFLSVAATKICNYMVNRVISSYFVQNYVDLTNIDNQ